MADDVDDLTEGQDSNTAVQHDEWQPSDVDKVAMKLGWRPQAEWQGEEGDWVDSEAFLTKTKDMNKSMSKDLRDLRKQMDRIGQATASMTQQAVEAERAKWQEKWDEAFDTGNRDDLKRAEKELAKLDQPKAQQPTREVEDFASRNSGWFQKDEEATDYAFVRASYWQNKGVTDPGEQLEKVEADVKKRFPEHFEAKSTRKDPPALATPQRNVNVATKEKSVANLPPQAKKAMREWVSTMKENGNAWATEDMWAKNYYQSEEAANG